MLRTSALWQAIEGVDESTLFLSLYLKHYVLVASLRPVHKGIAKSAQKAPRQTLIRL